MDSFRDLVKRHPTRLAGEGNIALTVEAKHVLLSDGKGEVRIPHHALQSIGQQILLTDELLKMIPKGRGR